MVEDEDRLPSDIVALISGIDRRHLRAMERGSMTPSEDHAIRLEQSLGSDALEQFGHGTIPKPEYLELKRGVLPPGHRLIRRTTVGQLMVGDLIPYLPPQKAKSNLWVEVRSLEEDSTDEAGERLLVDMGGVAQVMNRSTAVRVARNVSREQSESRSSDDSEERGAGDH